jgi:hypothetical protein
MMKRFLLVLAILLTFLSSTSQAVFTGLTVMAAIDQLDSMVQEAIDKAGNEGRATTMVASGQARLAIDHLREAYADSLDKTFDKLDTQQKAIFRDLDSSISQLSDNIDQHIEDVDNIVDNLTTSIDASLIGTETPRVFQYTPKYYVDYSSSDKISITIKGKYLNFHEPIIKIKDKIYIPKTKTETELTYLIPKEKLLGEDTTVSHKTINLTVFKQKRLWYTLGIKRQNIPVNYSLLVYLLPKNIGHFSINVVRKIPRTERRSGRGPDWSITSGRRHDIRRSYSHASPSGWTFDVGSVSFHVTRADNGRKTNANVSPSAHVINVELWADGYRHHHNTFSGYLTYTEYRPTHDNKNETFKSKEKIKWKDSKVYTLPNHTVSYVIKLETFNGYSRSYNSNVADDSFLNISYDAGSRQIRIVPQKPAIAMGM